MAHHYEVGVCGLRVSSITKYTVDTIITRDPKLFARSQGLEIAISQGLHKDLTYAAAAAVADSRAAANIVDNNNRTSRQRRCTRVGSADVHAVALDVVNHTTYAALERTILHSLEQKVS